MRLATVHVHLHLSLIRSRLLRCQVVKTLHQQQTARTICQPALAVGVHLAVLVPLVRLIPRQPVLCLEIHQTSRPDAFHGRVKEDHASLVLDTCNLPGRHFPWLAALVSDGIGHDNRPVLLVGGERLPYPALQPLRYLAGHAQRSDFLLHHIRHLVELLYRRPVPLFLRTGPERAAEALRPSQLREHLAVVILQRQDLSALGGVDLHLHMAARQEIPALCAHFSLRQCRLCRHRQPSHGYCHQNCCE